MSLSATTGAQPAIDLARFEVTAADFHPRRLLANGHLQTIVGNFLPRHLHLPAPEPVLVEVAAPAIIAGQEQPAAQVLCHCHWQHPERRGAALTVILLHGLEGSSSSQYVLGNTHKLWHAGANVVRMNMRNCGGTEALSPTLYHSGLSTDVLAVMRFVIARERLTRVALVGYSMGGNLVLKLAGDLGSQPPPELCAAVGISPAIDLGDSADALHQGFNRIYERRFLRALLGRYRRKTELFPVIYDPARAAGITSLRLFDDRITAFYSGFTGADDYYFRAASARVVADITVPTLVLHALDDPFVRLSATTRLSLFANPHVLLLEPAHGGHCAFLADPDHRSGNDGYWAEHTLLRFLTAQCQPALPVPESSTRNVR